MKWILLLPLLLISTLASAYELTIKIPGKDPVVMTMEQLKADLPETRFTTQLPWLPEDESDTFTGFTMVNLLNYLHVTEATSVTFIALNDYAASAPINDIKRYQPIVAYSMNDAPMKVRDKGPFWFLYNISQYPKTDSPEYHTQMVWQIKEISINY